MSQFLDKTMTVSIRQVLRLGIWFSFLMVTIYVALFFMEGWQIKMGGVTLQRSPFRDRVPEQCFGYVDRHLSGIPASSTSADAFLLRGKFRRVEITELIGADSLTPQCFGYILLGGLHQSGPHDVDFTDQWIDADGTPVVTVQVQFHKPYLKIQGNSK